MVNWVLPLLHGKHGYLCLKSKSNFSTVPMSKTVTRVAYTSQIAQRSPQNMIKMKKRTPPTPPANSSLTSCPTNNNARYVPRGLQPARGHFFRWPAGCRFRSPAEKFCGTKPNIAIPLIYIWFNRFPPISFLLANAQLSAVQQNNMACAPPIACRFTQFLIKRFRNPTYCLIDMPQNRYIFNGE